MKLAATLLGPLAALSLAACGSSEQSTQQAAVNTMCKARADIHDQVVQLKGMVAAPGTPQAAATAVRTIRDDITTIKGAVPDLRPAEQQTAGAASDTFNAELQRNASDLDAAAARFAAARDRVAAADQQLTLPVNC